MPYLLTLVAPIGLLLPLAGHSGSSAAEPTITKVNAPATSSQVSLQISPLRALRQEQVLRQVRIEKRVIVRISPQRGPAPQSLLGQLPRQALTARYEERKMDKCLPVEGIAGVQTGSGNRLLLFLRDQRIITLNLEKACRARDFYSGFYVERSDDGNLCVRRDQLHSRSGAKCEVERMRQLVAVND